MLDISYHTLQAYLRYPIHDPVPAGDETWQIETSPDHAMAGEAPVACVATEEV